MICAKRQSIHAHLIHVSINDCEPTDNKVGNILERQRSSSSDPSAHDSASNIPPPQPEKTPPLQPEYFEKNLHENQPGTRGVGSHNNSHFRYESHLESSNESRPSNETLTISSSPSDESSLAECKRERFDRNCTSQSPSEEVRTSGKNR